MSTKRTDVHRPGAIDPANYYFVALGYQKMESIDDCFMVAEERKALERHKETHPGAHFSGHAHGGNCHVCGAACIYDVIFFHPQTNTYIRTGMDCAEKMHLGDPARFRAFRKAIDEARERKAGKAKAQALLADAGLESAWTAYAATKKAHAEGLDWGKTPKEECTLVDIVERLIRFGSISEGQVKYLRVLLDRIARRPEIEAQRAAEREAAAPCPKGKAVIRGTVLKAEERETEFGPTVKITVKDESGFVAWGTSPAALGAVDRGAKVEFTATFEPSERDPKFGFFKRPRLASVIEPAPARPEA